LKKGGFEMKIASKKKIISIRKSCNSEGTGLSHYVVLENGK
jgi:modified peptide precursor CbpA